MKKWVIIILAIIMLVLKYYVTSHSRIYYIPAIKMYVKVTANYYTDISYVYLSHSKEFGDNYIKFMSFDKNFPDIPLHYVDFKSVDIYTKNSSIIKEVKSSPRINYNLIDSVIDWKAQNKPLIIIYGRGSFVSFYNRERIDEDVIEQ